MIFFNEFYYTPLQVAVKNDSIEIVKLLISMPNIDANIQNIPSILYFLYNFQSKYNNGILY